MKGRITNDLWVTYLFKDCEKKNPFLFHSFWADYYKPKKGKVSMIMSDEVLDEVERLKKIIHEKDDNAERIITTAIGVFLSICGGFSDEDFNEIVEHVRGWREHCKK